jgi:hypothetical protein
VKFGLRNGRTTGLDAAVDRIDKPPQQSAVTVRGENPRSKADSGNDKAAIPHSRNRIHSRLDVRKEYFSIHGDRFSVVTARCEQEPCNGTENDAPRRPHEEKAHAGDSIVI